MKSQQELKDAHDLLYAVLSGYWPINLDPQGRCILEAQYEVLCFVLKHEGADSFQRSIDSLRGVLDKVGTWQRRQLKHKAVALAE